jgi:hypothetical protein
MTSDFRLIETACIHGLYKPVFGTELGKSSSAAFNSQTTLPKLVFTDCWDLADPNKGYGPCSAVGASGKSGWEVARSNPDYAVNMLPHVERGV